MALPHLKRGGSVRIRKGESLMYTAKLLPLMLLPFLGCDATTIHPTIYIDDSFYQDEMTPLLYGAVSWDRGTEGQIHHTVRFVKHALIYSLSTSGRYDNAVYFLRADSSTDEYCPEDKGVSIGSDATTHNTTLNGVSIICFDAYKMDKLRLYDVPVEQNKFTVWANAGAHEIGHSLELGHIDTKEAVMYPSIHSMIDISCVDIINVSFRWGLNIPERCK